MRHNLALVFALATLVCLGQLTWGLAVYTDAAAAASSLQATEQDVGGQKFFLPPNEGRTGFIYKSGAGANSFTVCVAGAGSACTGNAVATAIYKVGLNERGWDELTLTTNADFSDLDQAYAAGYLEGAMTWERIHSLYRAWIQNKYRKEPTRRAKIFDYVLRQDKFLQSKIAEFAAQPMAPEAKYWHAVALIRQQLMGMLDGYNAQIAANGGTSMQLGEIWLLNDDGDIFDIERIVNRRPAPSAINRTVKVPVFSFAEAEAKKHESKAETTETTEDEYEIPRLMPKPLEEMSREELTEFVELNGHCTVLIKRTANDLLVAHSTWSDYRELFRIYKHYNFNYAGAFSKSLSLSSYPGMIASSDDFYILGSGLVITETTLTILNEALYKHADPASTVPAVVRSLVANLLASDAQSWVSIFSKYNSGTYNNQWMILDMNKFEPTKPLVPGTFIVLEQIPGKIVSRDMSEHLDRNKYWGSYNRPYFNEINKASMFKTASALHGEDFTYLSSPRAKILARDHERVTDAQSALNLLRENNYKTDPLSQGCVQNTLGARFDLPSLPSCPAKIARPRAYGAVDVKVTSFAMHKERSALVVSGPTQSASAPGFSWSKAGALARLRPPAQPDSLVFEPVVIAPSSTPAFTDAQSKQSALLQTAVDVDAEAEAEAEADVDAEEEVEAEVEAEAEAEAQAEEELATEEQEQ